MWWLRAPRSGKTDTPLFHSIMTGLTNKGEEFYLKYIWTEQATKPASFTVGIYDDATDTIGDADDMAAITSEPSGAAYSPQSVNFGTTNISASLSSGNWQIDIADVTFDVSDSDAGTVDAFYLSVNVQLGGDSSATEHLVLTGALDTSYNLGQYSTFTIQNAGHTID